MDPHRAMSGSHNVWIASQCHPEEKHSPDVILSEADHLRMQMIAEPKDPYSLHEKRLDLGLAPRLTLFLGAWS